MAQQDIPGIQARLLKVAQMLAACGDINDRKRKFAVKALEDLYTAHREAFFKLVTYCFAGPPSKLSPLPPKIQGLVNDLGVRHQAGLLLKNKLDTKVKDPQLRQLREKSWLELPAPLREELKRQLVEVLSCKDVRVGKTSGQIIAKIGNVEIPRKVWNGLIPGLVRLALTQPAAQEAALSTLGFLCDDLGSEHVPPEQTNKMLNAIVKGYNNPAPAIVFAASIALKNSLTFIEKNFEMKPHRDKIMQTLLQKGCLHPTEKVRLQNLQTLVEVVELYYHRMPAYFEAAKKVTYIAIGQYGKSPDCAINGLEFWNFLAEVEENLADKAAEAARNHVAVDETKKNHQFIVRNLNALIQIVLKLMETQEDDQESDAWNLSICAGVCFGLMSNCAKDQILKNPRLQQFFLEYFSGKVSSWRRQEACFIAFGALQEGVSSKGLEGMIKKVMPILMQALRNEAIKPLVRDSAAWALSRICQFNFRAIPRQLLAAALQVATDFLCVKAPPRVAVHGCTFCFYFASGCQAVYGDSKANPLGAQVLFTRIIRVLLETTKRPDWQQSGLRMAAFESMNIVIEKAPTSVAFLLPSKLWPLFVNTLKETRTSGGDKVARETLQTLLCASLNQTMRAIEKVLQTKSPATVNAVVTEGLADRTMACLLDVLTTPESVAHEEAFMAIVAIADIIGHRFTRYMNKLIDPLTRSLANLAAANLSMQAAQTVSALCPALGAEAMNTLIPFRGKSKSYAQIFVEQLIRNLDALSSTSAIATPLRNSTIAALGDLTSVMEAKFVPYLPHAFKVVLEAGKITLELLDTDDEDEEDAMADLEEEMLTFYSAVMQNVRNEKGELNSYMGHIGRYFRSLSQRGELCPNTIRVLVTALGDCADVFQQVCKPLFVDQNGFRPEIGQIFQRTDVFNTDEEMQSFDYAQKMIKAVIK